MASAKYIGLGEGVNVNSRLGHRGQAGHDAMGGVCPAAASCCDGTGSVAPGHGAGSSQDSRAAPLGSASSRNEKFE
jgi:hypothetical protein